MGSLSRSSIRGTSMLMILLHNTTLLLTFPDYDAAGVKLLTVFTFKKMLAER